jgi:hypothetical protein
LLEDEGRSWVGGCKCSVPVVLYCDMNNQWSRKFNCFLKVLQTGNDVINNWWT